MRAFDVAATDWTTVGALLTAGFTGALALLGAVSYALGRRDRKADRRLAQRRADLKQALGEAMDRGRFLNHAKDVSDGDVLSWTSSVADLIDAALGRGEQHVWFATARLHDDEVGGSARSNWLARCDTALAHLVQRVDSLDVREDFKAEAWQWHQAHKALE